MLAGAGIDAGQPRRPLDAKRQIEKGFPKLTAVTAPRVSFCLLRFDDT
jgi:hypothetical protein